MISIQVLDVTPFPCAFRCRIRSINESFEHKSILAIGALSTIDLQIGNEKKHPDNRKRSDRRGVFNAPERRPAGLSAQRQHPG
jgi:hypothetical protein